MKTGIDLIAKERNRQIHEKNYTLEWDLDNTFDQLSEAAAMYALPAHRRALSKTNVPVLWPWYGTSWKPSPEDRIRELQKAGALIAAAIDRLTNGG